MSERMDLEHVDLMTSSKRNISGAFPPPELRKATNGMVLDGNQNGEGKEMPLQRDTDSLPLVLVHKSAQALGHDSSIATLDLSFSRFGAEETIAMTVEGNVGSWGLMNRLGMRRRPDLDFDETMWSQDYGMVIVYSIAKDAWAAHRETLIG